MLNKRIFVKKKAGFNNKEKALLKDFKTNLKLKDLKSIKYYIIYDIFNTTHKELEMAQDKVFSEVNTDDVFESINLEKKVYLSVETLPNQFDQRAKSANECMYLLNPNSKAQIKTAELLIFDTIDELEMQKVKNYYINDVESQEKDLSVLDLYKNVFETKEEVLIGFRKLDDQGLKKLLESRGLSLSFENLKYCQEYFLKEGRDPILGELKVIDTYWSDHCRHTTFNTILQNIKIEDPNILEVYNRYLEIKESVSKNKPISLMDLATIYGKYAKKTKILTNLEDTEEDNAISLIIKEDNEEYLYQFKNETHNHPTEIEPFGGASTCIGGAIRDPLSGRAYVYQGLRIAGAHDILQSVEKTLKGKLPQKIISQKSAEGFSSYGNQIGLSTTFVKEIYHPGYVAKHLEAGAVVGIVKKDDIIRLKPKKGDIILLLGGKTGYDGIGGATGSSKSHTTDSLLTSSVEVQKGNAPEERKIQRLFTNKKALKLIKKCNDFGAGGVSVAIGELSPSIEIYLDQVPLKVDSLKASDIALSESQERMAVVIDASKKEEFIKYAKEENLEAKEVAKVTDDKRLKMYYNGEIIIDIKREFLDTQGVKNYQDVVIKDLKDKNIKSPKTLRECFENPNLIDNKNMDLMFDSTVMATTVLMPLGGKYEQTKEQTSVQKIPFLKETTSHVAYGFNPYIMEANPFKGAQKAVIDSIFKVVVSGVKLKDINLSFQEYFKRLDGKSEAYGEVLMALLGALKAQEEFQTPALGGKDSMSGTYENLHVPPTLISFAYGTSKIKNVISNTQRKSGENIYLLKSDDLDYTNLVENIKVYEDLVENKKISQAAHVGENGIALCITKMLMGNKLGCEVDVQEDLYTSLFGSIILTSSYDLNLLKIGEVVDTKVIRINDQKENIEDLININNSYFEDAYPCIPTLSKKDKDEHLEEIKRLANLKKDVKRSYNPKQKTVPKVFIPVFPGTNSEFEMQQAFLQEGFEVQVGVFKNISNELLEASIDEFEKAILECDVFAIPGGFSGGDEPDGSGKYIVGVLSNSKIKEAIHNHLSQDKLILGICNGFQALIKSGLITSSKVEPLQKSDPTLFKNDCNFHISKTVKTKVQTTNSPWLKGIDQDIEFTQVISHGEGKVAVDPKVGQKLFEQDQVAFIYSGDNPNGSFGNIEGLISPCGKILGKMAHSERYIEGLYQNIEGQKKLNIFKNAYNYFTIDDE